MPFTTFSSFRSRDKPDCVSLCQLLLIAYLLRLNNGLDSCQPFLSFIHVICIIMRKTAAKVRKNAYIKTKNEEYFYKKW